MNSFQNTTKPLVSIVFPVYNEEKFLKNKLENILSQTLENFELIISADPSKDSTTEICREYARKDKRIRYFEQNKKMGWEWSYNFVTQKATGKYCVWAAADDRWSPNYLESNVKILEANEKIVGSVSKIKYFDDNGLIENQKKYEYPYHKYPLNGTYEEKASFYLRTISCENLYAVFRTEAFKQSQVRKMIACDGAILLKVLKFGDILVSDDVLLHRYRYGSTHTEDLFKRIRDRNGDGIIGFVFPYLPYTLWCLKNMGIKFFIKNIDFFFKINFGMQKAIVMTLLRGKKTIEAQK